MGFIKVDKKAVDPALASLFASSSGPVEAPPKSRYQPRIQRPIEEESSADIEEEDDEVLSELSSQDDSDASEDDNEDSDEQDDADSDSETSSEGEEDAEEVARKAVLAKEDNSKKKRKRADKEEIEETYMRKLAREEEKEEEQRQKKRKIAETVEETTESEESSDESEADEDGDEAEEEFTIPKHETQAETTDRDASEIEKATRTVFLSNVSNECIDSKTSKKALKKYLESFIVDLADNKPPHKIESIRFRSTAFASALPKRAAFAKKEIMESTTHGTNAYAVYSTKVAAREAVKRLNGTIFLNRHLHVDSVAHPRENDHRRRVFVGNLPFVDDESQTPNPDGSEKKKKTPSDVEEGLWVHFSKVGKVESVRVVRDAQTRVGKGFAYVQFVDQNGVEGALQLNEKKYPPMLPRKLRVTRCRAEKKNNKKEKPRGPAPSAKPNGKSGYAPKMSEEQKSQQGRARSMLGKVAKAQSKEAFVFEGHRASEKQGKAGLKFKGSGGNKKKGPNGRKSRSSAWKSKAK